MGELSTKVQGMLHRVKSEFKSRLWQWMIIMVATRVDDPDTWQASRAVLHALEELELENPRWFNEKPPSDRLTGAPY